MGDASELVAAMDVQPEGDRRYRVAAHPPSERPVVEGSELLGQAIVACGHEEPGRRVVSSSLVFARPVDSAAPYVIELDPLSSGRTFAVPSVRVVQNDKVCAAGVFLLDVTAPEVIAHADPPPEVVGPEDAAPCALFGGGRDVRIVDDAYDGDPDAPVGPPELDAWVRCHDVPDDPALHAGLLADFTGRLSIAAALRPHAGVGQSQAHRTLSTAVNAISLSIHADVRADQWLLYHHRSTSAAGGMTHAECRVHDQAGALVASFTVDAMVRGLAPRPQGDARPTF